jgi:hypothetical protein
MASTSEAVLLVDTDEAEQRPMTDAEHKAVFGWAWDDPDAEGSE